MLACANLHYSKQPLQPLSGRVPALLSPSARGKSRRAFVAKLAAGDLRVCSREAVLADGAKGRVVVDLEAARSPAFLHLLRRELEGLVLVCARTRTVGTPKRVRTRLSRSWRRAARPDCEAEGCRADSRRTGDDGLQRPWRRHHTSRPRGLTTKTAVRTLARRTFQHFPAQIGCYRRRGRGRGDGRGASAWLRTRVLART